MSGQSAGPYQGLRQLPERSRLVLFAVGAASIVALVTRAYAGTRSGLWRDEGLFLFIAGEPSIGNIFEFLRTHESHPPLFYLVMRGWLAVWGNTETAAISLPIILGTLMIPAIYVAGSRLADARTGVVAAAVAAVAPPFVAYSALIRPYSWLPLLYLAATYALWRALTTGARRAWAVYAVAMLALLLTHNWSWLVLGAHWLAVAISVTFRLVDRPAAALAREWIVTQVAIGVAYSPWLPALLYQITHAGHAPPEEAVTFYRVVGLSLASTLARDAFVVPAVAAAAIVAMAWHWRRKSRRKVDDGAADARRGTPDTEVKRSFALRALLLLGVPVFAISAAALMSMRSDLLIGRCIAMTAPAIVIAYAYGLSWLASRIGAWPGTLVTLLVLGRLGGLTMARSYERSNAREAAATVAAEALPSDLIILSPEWFSSSFNYYFSPTNEQINYPVLGRRRTVSFNRVKERMADPVALDRAKKKLSRARAENRRVWFITGFANMSAEELPAEEAGALESPRWMWISFVRTAQIRAHLDELYGPPDSSAALLRDSTVYDEHLYVVLYRPR